MFPDEQDENMFGTSVIVIGVLGEVSSVWVLGFLRYVQYIYKTTVGK